MPSVSIFRPTKVVKGVTQKTTVFWMQWTDPTTKKRCRESTGARHKSVAQKIANERQKQLELDPWGLSVVKLDRHKWQDLLALFLQHKRATTRPQTASTYEISLTQFTKIVGNPWVHEIREATLQDFASKRLGEGTAVATVNKDLRHIRCCINFAVTRGMLQRLPSFRDAMVREDQKAPRIVPRDQRATLLATLERTDLDLRFRPAPWYRVFLLMVADLGVRRGEVLGLTWSAVDFTNDEVTIAAESSKGRRYRKVPSTPELTETLKVWRATAGEVVESEKVLPWPAKHDLRNFYRDWDRITKAAGLAGLKPTPKSFRSTRGSELIQSGSSTVIVKDLLGHASVTTTERYYINTSPSLRAAVEACTKMHSPETSA